MARTRGSLALPAWRAKISVPTSTPCWALTRRMPFSQTLKAAKAPPQKSSAPGASMTLIFLPSNSASAVNGTLVQLLDLGVVGDGVLVLNGAPPVDDLAFEKDGLGQRGLAGLGGAQKDNVADVFGGILFHFSVVILLFLQNCGLSAQSAKIINLKSITNKKNVKALEKSILGRISSPAAPEGRRAGF